MLFAGDACDANSVLLVNDGRENAAGDGVDGVLRICDDAGPRTGRGDSAAARRLLDDASWNPVVAVVVKPGSLTDSGGSSARASPASALILSSSSLFHASSFAFANANALAEGLMTPLLDAVVNPTSAEPVENVGAWNTGVISTATGLNQES
jgi:hypothetical protein